MYTDESKILETVQNISSTVVAEDAEATDRLARWPERSLRSFQKEGLGGLTVPVEYGGLGQGTKTLAKVCEIIGQSCTSTAICYGMHAVGSAVIASKATDYQQEKYLTPICEGRHLTSIALNETGSGSQFYLPQTRMQYHSESEYNINGAKSFVLNGGKADSYIISAVAEGSHTPGEQFNCFMINADAAGIQWGERWKGIGLRGDSSRDLFLDSVKIPDKNILGQFGDQIWYVFNVITPYFLTAMAGSYLGIARAAINEVTHHIKNREFSFNGRALASSSVIQYQLGALWAKYARSRALVYYATECYDMDQDNALIDLFAAKAEVADATIEIVNEAITLCGGYAYQEKSILDLLLRDARAAHVMTPTADILRVWTGRSILEQPLLADT
ncbi:MAG: acyl-CoA/acyl-ACP dehydrogenase [Piscirickettsiaceae bacterium]|jgi:alkylation response protein AidB-like acyl-CoA dehydrogenase|nr:acyl-CoA/acyl-ACP dehydrogenase [Piscirickettsiaceae bacterium]